MFEGRFSPGLERAWVIVGGEAKSLLPSRASGRQQTLKKFVKPEDCGDLCYASF